MRGVLLLAGLALASTAPARAGGEPTILVVVQEKVMGVFDTTGFEQPRHVEGLLAADLAERGLSALDLNAVERATSRAKARQLLEGDEVSAREVALQQQAQYLLMGSATSKPAGSRMFGTNMQSLQANVTLRLIRNDDGEVLGTASTQASEAHMDEVQGGILALTEATEKALEQLGPILDEVVRQEALGVGDLTVQVKDLVSFRHLDFLMGFFLDDVPGVDDARLRDFHGGVAEIALATSAGAEQVARTAASARFKGFRLRVTHVTSSRVEMEVVLEE